MSVERLPLSQTYRYMSNVPLLWSPKAMKDSPALSTALRSLTELVSAHGNQKAMLLSMSVMLMRNLCVKSPLK